MQINEYKPLKKIHKSDIGMPIKIVRFLAAGRSGPLRQSSLLLSARKLLKNQPRLKRSIKRQKKNMMKPKKPIMNI